MRPRGFTEGRVIDQVSPLEDLVQALRNKMLVENQPEVVRAKFEAFTNTTNVLSLAGRSLKADFVVALGRLLPKCSLTSLDLRMNNVEQIGAETLTATLRNNASLTSLDFKNCCLREAGGLALAGLFQTMPALRRLTLAGNNMGPKASVAIFKDLEGHPALEELYFSWNKVGYAKATGKALQTLVATSPRLRLLDLAGNRLGSAAAALMKGICENKDCSLQYLGLSTNGIKDTAGELILRALSENDTLEVVDLSTNRLKSTLLRIPPLFEMKAKLKKVRLEFNVVGKEQNRVLLEMELLQFVPWRDLANIVLQYIPDEHYNNRKLF